MDPKAELRRRMVDEQLATRDITDLRVLHAMKFVPRDAFVPPKFVDQAYEDRPIPVEEGQVITQPYLVALMAQALKLDSASRVLEVGTGSGYAAAVMSLLAAEVYSIERIPILAENARRVLQNLGYRNVHVKLGDGTQGWKEHAPFDAISVAASASKVPDPLLEQMARGGRMVIPIGPSLLEQELTRITRRGEQLQVEPLSGVCFVPLVSTSDPSESRRPH